MAFLMLILLLAFTIISYFFGKRNLLSPWFLLCLMFLATFLIVLINYDRWDLDINSKFVVYITTAIMAFGGGCIVVQSLQVEKPSCRVNKQMLCKAETRVISVKYPVNIFLLTSFTKLFIDAGDNPSLTSTLRRIYEMQSVGGYSPGFVFNQMREIVIAISYLNVFRLLVGYYSKSDKISFVKLIIPIILFLIMALFSTERNLFLRFAIYCLIIWIFIYGSKQNSKNANLKIVVRAALILVVFACIFFLFGLAKQYESKFFDQISIYSASGLNNFNIWIENFNEPLKYGQSTFTTFLGSFGTVLEIFGIELNGTVEQIDKFIIYTSNNGFYYESNIYSALKPYVEDFGYFGVILFPLIIGVFYQWLYLKAKRSTHSFSWIIYALLIYPIIYFPILEQLFRRFHLGFLYEIVWISVLYYCVFGKVRLKVKPQVAIKTEEVKGSVRK